MRTALLLVLCLAACGGAAAPSAPVALPAIPAPFPAPTPTPAPTAALGLPRGASLVVAFDVPSTVLRVDELRSSFEDELHVPRGGLPGQLASMGLDPARPWSFAMAGPDDAQQKLAETLRAITAQMPTTGPGMLDAVARIHEADAPTTARLLLPAADPAKLHDAVADLLKKQHWEEHAGVLVRGHAVVLLATDATQLAVDFGAARSPAIAETAIRAWRTDASEPAPPLDGAALHATWTPAALAIADAAQGAVEVTEVISGEGLDPSQKARVAAEGFSEAAGAFTLAGGDRGAYFDGVDLVVRGAPFEATVRVRPGPGLPTIPPAAWTASSAPVFPDAIASMDVSAALLAAWPSTASPARLLRTAKEAGALGWLLALPHALVDAPLAVAGAEGAGIDVPWSTRFERIGFAWRGGDPTVLALLPAGTKRGAAECALAPKTPCDAKTRLTLGAVTTGGKLHAKLVSVGGRFVVLAGESDAALAGTPSMQPAGPARAELAAKQILGTLGISGPVPDRVVLEVRREAPAVVFRVAPR